MQVYMPPFEAVRACVCALKLQGVTSLMIYDACGANPNWLASMRSGRLKDPGYEQTRPIIEWLATEHTALFMEQINNLESGI